MSLLEIKDLHARVGGREILKGVNLVLDPADGSSLAQQRLLGVGLQRQPQRGAQLWFPLDGDSREGIHDQVEPSPRIAGCISR